MYYIMTSFPVMSMISIAQSNLSLDLVAFSPHLPSQSPPSRIRCRQTRQVYKLTSCPVTSMTPSDPPLVALTKSLTTIPSLTTLIKILHTDFISYDLYDPIYNPSLVTLSSSLTTILSLTNRIKVQHTDIVPCDLHDSLLTRHWLPSSLTTIPSLRNSMSDRSSA